MTTGAAIALLSAVTQAVAHALLKSGRDKLVVRGLIGLTGAVVMLPVALAVPAPVNVAGWLAASAIVHAVYQLVLIEAYKASDFSVAYPLARGTAPLATALLGVVLLHEALRVLVVAGVIVTSAGMLLVVRGARPSRTGLFAALGAGLLTSTYTLIDARGVRGVDDPLSFIAWFFVLDGVVMASIAAVARRRRLVEVIRDDARTGTIAGLTSLVTYGAALAALRLLPVGAASALRETSVVFGALIARFALRETVPAQRAAGAALVAVGAALILVGLKT